MRMRFRKIPRGKIRWLSRTRKVNIKRSSVTHDWEQTVTFAQTTLPCERVVSRSLHGNNVSLRVAQPSGAALGSISIFLDDAGRWALSCPQSRSLGKPSAGQRPSVIVT